MYKSKTRKATETRPNARNYGLKLKRVCANGLGKRATNERERAHR